MSIAYAATFSTSRVRTRLVSEDEETSGTVFVSHGAEQGDEANVTDLFITLGPDRIENQVLELLRSDTNYELDEPKVSKSALDAAMNVLAGVRPASLLMRADVSTFYGELNLTWEYGQRQVILLSYSDPQRPPLIHHYEYRLGGQSMHGIEQASSERLATWLRWLRQPA
jgi:hypothetical protein